MKKLITLLSDSFRIRVFLVDIGKTKKRVTRDLTTHTQPKLSCVGRTANAVHVVPTPKKFKKRYDGSICCGVSSSEIQK